MKRIPFFLLTFCLFNLSRAQSLIVGTYTNKGTSKGIYVYSFDSKELTAQLSHTAEPVVNPSYVALSPDKRHLYAVNESGKNSAVSAFEYKKDGSLQFINQIPSPGADPCYVLVSRKHVITANYSGGNIVVYSRDAKGALKEVVQVVQHTGKSIDPRKRQESAHVHQVKFSPDGKYLLATDLGEDHLYTYHYRPESKEVLQLKSKVKTTPGSGPRHFTFSRNGNYVYVAHEYNGHIGVFAYQDGNLRLIEEIPSMSPEFKGNIDAADIHLSKDGKFLYQSNRGEANTLTVFRIAEDGRLTKVQQLSSLGKGPRNFSLSPDGKALLVAHQYTNDIVIFHRDPTTGLLRESGKKIDIGSPVCLLFDQ